MTTALLDGDVIAYRASVVAEDDIDWGDGQEGKTVDPNRALAVARHLVKQWTELAGCDDAVVCLSPRDGSNFRKLICPTYKAGRGEKPQEHAHVLDMIEAEYRTYTVQHLEADDLLGLMATSGKLDAPVVVTIDKDLRTVPGRLILEGKDKRPRIIRKAEATAFWMQQVMTGDITDGYPGCPGVGLAGAQKMLGNHVVYVPERKRVTRGKHAGTIKTTYSTRPAPSLWAGIVSLYEKAGLTEDHAILQARLARILQHGDYNHETREVSLWHPNTARIKTLRLP